MPKLSNLERRTLRYQTSEVRAIVRNSTNSDGSKALAIDGFAAKYGVLSQFLGGGEGGGDRSFSFRERIQRGAFTKAVRNKDILCLFNHDRNFVLGRTASGTLALKDIDEGLYFRCNLPNTETARSLHESISRGDVVGTSFSFSMDGGSDEWSDEEDPENRGRKFAVRTLKSVGQLFDVGPVTTPAYNLGQSVNARSQFPMPGPLVICRTRIPEQIEQRLCGTRPPHLNDAALVARRKKLLDQILSM